MAEAESPVTLLHAGRLTPPPQEGGGQWDQCSTPMNGAPLIALLSVHRQGWVMREGGEEREAETDRQTHRQKETYIRLIKVHPSARLDPGLPASSEHSVAEISIVDFIL